jgi:outer membrane receptor protein involved in Fe transport
VKLVKKWETMEAYAAVNNLLDEEYSTRFGSDLTDRDYPMPGINFVVGLKKMF